MLITMVELLLYINCKHKNLMIEDTHKYSNHTPISYGLKNGTKTQT